MFCFCLNGTDILVVPFVCLWLTKTILRQQIVIKSTRHNYSQIFICFNGRQTEHWCTAKVGDAIFENLKLLIFSFFYIRIIFVSSQALLLQTYSDLSGTVFSFLSTLSTSTFLYIKCVSKNLSLLIVICKLKWSS